MKTVLILALFCATSSVFGQFFVYTDTISTKDFIPLKIKAEIEEQKQFLIDLYTSPKGIERALREKRNYTSKQTGSRQDSIGDFIYYTVPMLSKEDSLEAISESYRRAEVLRDGSYSFLLTDIIKNQKRNSEPLSFLRKGQYFKIDTVFEVNAKTRLPVVFDRSSSGVSSGEIYFEYIVGIGDSSADVATFPVPIHEFSHLSTDGNKYLRYETSLFLGKLAEGSIIDCEGGRWFNTYTGQIYCYYDNPTEIKARIDALRYLLYKEGLYDARYEDFTEDMLAFLLTNSSISRNTNIKELVAYVLKDFKSLVWMMNNVQ